LDRVYAARTDEELARGYDGWAARYDEDLARFGYRLPAVTMGLVGRHVAAEARPILEAACGTGLVGEALAVLGYADLAGFDLSEGMLAVARAKGVYRSLAQMRLGDRLDFPDAQFAATLAVGVFTAGHAGPEGFDELIRVTRPGAPLIISIRVDTEPQTGFFERQEALEHQGFWRLVERTAAFPSMPAEDPEILHRIFVYRRS
jgi:SAM-dependent methyltransferase